MGAQEEKRELRTPLRILYPVCLRLTIPETSFITVTAVHKSTSLSEIKDLL